jgi:hypothetical protein
VSDAWEGEEKGFTSLDFSRASGSRSLNGSRFGLSENLELCSASPAPMIHFASQPKK